MELLRDQLHKLTPVIFITGHDDEAAMQRAYEFGAVDYPVKPISPEILRGKVRNLVVLYEQGIELERRAVLLAEQHQRLIEANALLREQDTNIGIVVHDLRTPLASIVNGAHLLTKLPFYQDHAQRIAERINRSALRMSSMIRDILDFTRGRLGGRIPLDRQRTDLATISRAVVDELQTGHPTARVVVETAGTLTGDWDPARIEQALSNLLANAIQHGGSDVALTASGEDGDQVVVSVRNGGRPIPPEQLPNLFAPFKAVRSNGSAAHLGLGLFIVREIVHAHNGSVAVTSSSAGTVFSVRLPRSENVGDKSPGTTEETVLAAP